MKNLDYKEMGFSDELIAILLGTQSTTQIFIPKKLNAAIDRHLSKPALKAIHPDKTVAKELILSVVALLVPTIYDTENIMGWRHISATTLHSITKINRSNTIVYKKIIDLLVKGTEDKGSIIEVDNKYIVGEKTKQYRLTDTYKVGAEKYTLTTPFLIRRKQNHYNEKVLLASKNAIAMNCLQVQSMIDLPSHEEVLEEGKRLVKLGYKTNKGKVLTMRNKHNNEYWSDASNRSFVEDNLEQFKLLTDIGLLIPMIGNEKSGGRVVDSFTLMPSWIRKMITINGQPIAERDFSALHPNIASSIYGTASKTIKHQDAADYLKISRQEAKIENLSFFNKKEVMMKKSPLWDYYVNNYNDMMNGLIDDKRSSEFGYKITSMKLFKAETDLMTEVIQELNYQGIFVVYVYDALYCQEDLAEEVGRVMNEKAVQMNILTTT